MARLDVDHVYVIHVSKGAEDRARSIEHQLARLGIEFEYVLEGDVEDLTPQLLDRWFTGPMKRKHRNTSCCCKHLIAWSRMVRDGCGDALVLEDDIFLFDNFIRDLNASVKERRALPDGGAGAAYVSLENSGLKRVLEAHGSSTLYRRSHMRETGAYWLNLAAAGRLLGIAETEKVSVRTPPFIASAVNSGAVELWWRHPAIAEQGSINGRFDSMLDPKRTGLMRRPRWLARKWFQRYLRPIIDRLRGVTR